MKKIAITGLMGSGKSLVSEILRRKGYLVFSCDEAVCEMYIETHKLYPQLQQIVKASGDLKSAMRHRFFEDSELKATVEKLIHQQVLKEMECFFETANQETVFAEVPLLFELGWENYFDESIAVICDKEISQKRLSLHRGFSVEEVEKRWEHQDSNKIKIDKATYTIYNNGTKIELEEKIDQLLERWRNF
ncbi:MAG: dephospho-CoA kinase [Anaerorhabdus sp.]